jgi:hypothetical protein
VHPVRVRRVDRAPSGGEREQARLKALREVERDDKVSDPPPTRRARRKAQRKVWSFASMQAGERPAARAAESDLPGVVDVRRAIGSIQSAATS